MHAVVVSLAVYTLSTGAPDAPQAPGRACIGDGSSQEGACVAAAPSSTNVVGTPLQTCSTDPLTGFYRNGRCETGADDRGVHVVCAEMTTAFLRFSKQRGNDLMTPAPRYRFPGLKPKDRWCLCAARFAEAAAAGVAPPVVLQATHSAALKTVSMKTLRQTVAKPSSAGGPLRSAKPADVN
ncbi:MAG: DUF2237 domain-containing protein [Myxococcota bacterium]